MSRLSTIRDAIYVAIEAKRLANQFVINDFEANVSYLPLSTIKELETGGGRVWIVGLGSDENILTRAPSAENDLPVQVALQRSINPKDFDLQEDLITLHEQLRDVCRKLRLTNYSWQRNVALRDPEGTPYAFMALREGTLFEAYFTAHYKHVIQT